MKPKVAVFDFTSCEGCELQILNCEEEIPDFVAALEFVTFREAMDGRADAYDIAFIDGACSRESEAARMREIRQRAKMVIPIGACAVQGCVHTLKNRYPVDELLRDQYGEMAERFDTFAVRPVSAVIPIDSFIPGCPIVNSEFVRVVQELLAGKVPDQPSNPVCAECKVAQNVCVYDKGQTCLGPVTRGGCRATCVTGGAVCWGCRGLIDEPNIAAQKEIMKNAGLDSGEMERRFNLFNQYHEAVWK